MDLPHRYLIYTNAGNLLWLSFTGPNLIATKTSTFDRISCGRISSICPVGNHVSNSTAVDVSPTSNAFSAVRIGAVEMHGPEWMAVKCHLFQDIFQAETRN